MGNVNRKKLTQDAFFHYDVYEPEGKGPRPLVIALHGYGGNKESMMRFARAVNNCDYIIASLQGPHQHILRTDDLSKSLGYGFGWITGFDPQESITRNHNAILRVIETLNTHRKIDMGKIFLLGFSQSVALNFRFAFTYSETICGIIGICGGIPGDLTENDRYQSTKADVLYIAGERDEIYPLTKILENGRVLTRFANSVEIKHFDIAHKIPREAIPLVDRWIRKRLTV